MDLLIETTKDNVKLELWCRQTNQMKDHQQLKPDRQLTNQLLEALSQLLARQQLTYQNLTGVAVFAGPGPFTALRISHTVANSLAYSLGCPVANSAQSDWRTACLEQLQAGAKTPIKPTYGQPANITHPKKD